MIFLIKNCHEQIKTQVLYNIQDGWGYMFTLHLPYSEWTKKRININ